MSTNPHITPYDSLGLVLGGGGARGLAAIGVLEVLQDLRLRPAAIAGTSMGAVVGAFIAAGHPIPEMKKLATHTGLTDVVDDLSGTDRDVRRGILVRDHSRRREVDDHILAFGPVMSCPRVVGHAFLPVAITAAIALPGSKGVFSGGVNGSACPSFQVCRSSRHPRLPLKTVMT